MSDGIGRVVRLGEVAGVHGVRGWVKVISYTEPRTNLFHYSPWLLEHAGNRRAVAVEATREAGNRLIAKLAGYDDRDGAASLVGCGIDVPRQLLPECAPGEYYWSDLEGLEVIAASGSVLGRVERLQATGANDVLVLDPDGRRMIPFVQGSVVLDVDLARGRIVVDWDPAYWE